MARIRTIKPDYWKSEKMAARTPGPDGREARRMFVGLWNLAEDHGVLRGNPSYIRAELYPYDDDVATADVARWLGLLESGGFVVRFQRDESTYLWVRGFGDHQRINRPSPTSLPEPSDTERSEPATSPVTLIESSLSPHGALTVGKEGKGNRREGEAAAPVASPAVDALQLLWNTILPGFPEWAVSGKKRRAAALARLKERPEPEFWSSVLRHIQKTPFLRGENDRGWKANPDWLMKPDSATAVLEGKYDGKARIAHGRASEADKDWSGVPAGPDYDEPFEAAS